MRRQLSAGETLCKEGEYGATAFIILKGKFEVFINSARGAVRTERAKGLRGFFGALRTSLTKV